MSDSLRKIAARRVAGALSLAAALANVAVGAGEAPTMEPTVDEIVRGLESAEDAVKTLAVNYLCLDHVTLLRPGAKHDPEFQIADNAASLTRKSEVSWQMTRDGRARMEATLEITTVRDDGTSFDSGEKIVSTFDGKSGQWLETDRTRDGVEQPSMARSVSNLQRTHSTPFDMSTHHLGTPVSNLLVAGRAKAVERQTWEDRPVVVLELNPKTVREDYILRQRFWIDVERTVAVRRQSYVQRGADRPWGLHYQVDCTKFTEAEPGVWLPRAVETVNYHVTDEGQDFLTHKEQYAVVDWVVNQEIDASRFEQTYPEDALDLDHWKLGDPVPARR